MALKLLLFLYLIHNLCAQTERTAAKGYGGMAASAHYLATQAGIKVLKNCGSAADAAVAIQTVLTVVQPHKSGIGGGKFIMYYNHSNNTMYAIDGREEAPASFHGKIFCKNPDCFLNPSCDCNIDSQPATMTFQERRVGGLSVGVPATIHSLYRLYKYFGSGNIEWKDLFTDAIDIARNGFEMYEELYRDILADNAALSRFEATKAIFLNDDNEPIVDVNETMYNEDLAKTYEMTSESPEKAIELWYEGEIADAIIDAANNANNVVEYNGESDTTRHGLLTKEDLAGYRAVFREPSSSFYGNDVDPEYKMYGMNYPSSGSPSVQYLMNLMHSLINDQDNPDSSTFTNDDDSMVYSGTNAHYLISGNNVVFADRNQWMADMDFVDVPVDGLLDYDYINARYNTWFDVNVTEDMPNDTPPIDYGIPPGVDPDISQSNFGTNEEYGTSHYFVVDQWNNMACVTTTIEADFGSAVVVPGYGFLLNNELTDFDPINETIEGERVANGPEGGKKPRTSALDLFGLNDSMSLGGKRPRSSMGPMIVADSETNIPVIGVGSPGGSTIIGTVFQILFNSLIRNIDIQRAIDLPRVWAQNSFASNSIRIESLWYEYNSNFSQEMELRGYNMSVDGPFWNGTQGRCHAVRYVERTDDIDGYILLGGADDSRWSTASVEAVFYYDENGDNDEVLVCRNDGIEIKTLTDNERIGLIVSWIIVLVFVCFCIVNRSMIKKWCDKRRARMSGYADFDVDDKRKDTNNDNELNGSLVPQTARSTEASDLEMRDY